MKIDGGKMHMTPKQNWYRLFQRVGMPDHALNILFHGLMKDRNITFSLLSKNCNNSLKQRSILLVNTMKLLRLNRCLFMHGMKIVKMVLLLFLPLEMVLSTLMLYRKYFHLIVN